MASRFELVLDTGGKFHFLLRGPDGTELLNGQACDSRIMAQNAVLHARSALKDRVNLVDQQGKDGKYCLVVMDKDGSSLARSPSGASAAALQPIRDAILAIAAAAPIVDLTKRGTAANAR